jgi:hypothetical protein
MALTLKKSLTADDVAKLAKPVRLKDGVYPARISEAWDQEAKKSKRPMIVVKFIVLDVEGNEREILLYLNTSDAGLQILRQTCIACDALDAFDSLEIEAALFPGHDVRVQICTEKNGKWPARSVIRDVLPAEESAVVRLRA